MGNAPTHGPDHLGNFMKGAAKGLINGLVVMGLFYGFLAAATTFGWFGLAPAAFELATFLGQYGATIIGGIFVSTAFTGYMSVQHGMEQHKHMTQQHGTMRGGHIEQASQHMAPVIIPAGAAVSAERSHEHQTEAAPARERQWAQSVNRSGDRLQQILANGSMSDKDRASAILREREERANAPQTASI